MCYLRVKKNECKYTIMNKGLSSILPIIKILGACALSTGEYVSLPKSVLWELTLSLIKVHH